MKEIQLTQGKVALIDDEDFERVDKYNWCAVTHGGNTFYAFGWVDGKGLKMHRFIMDAKVGQMIDHIDGNGLNNCRSNLRFCNAHENSMNNKRRRDGILKNDKKRNEDKIFFKVSGKPPLNPSDRLYPIPYMIEGSIIEKATGHEMTNNDDSNRVIIAEFKGMSKVVVK